MLMRPGGCCVAVQCGCTCNLRVLTVGRDINDRCHASQVGIRSVLRELPDSVSQQELEGVVRDLCEDDTIDGLLVQLPLPPHIDEEAIIDVRARPLCG